jgi:hypothetical protein
LATYRPPQLNSRALVNYESYSSMGYNQSYDSLRTLL